MPKRPKTRFFTIFFNFFHILGYLEGEFSPTGPRNPILGAGFTRRCPGNGRMLKKTKTGQNFTRESDPLGIVCRRTFLVRRRTKCSSVLFVDVRRRTSTNIDEQVPATRATHDEQRRTSTNNFFFPPHDEHRRTFCSSAHYA